MLPALLVAAAAAIYLRFRSKKVHDHTGRRSLKMATVGPTNATVTRLLSPPPSPRRYHGNGNGKVSEDFVVRVLARR